jgi:hypothetical protein
MNCPRPKCGSPAYVGLSDVKCTNRACPHFDQSELDDLNAKRKTEPKIKQYSPYDVQMRFSGVSLSIPSPSYAAIPLPPHIHCPVCPQKTYFVDRANQPRCCHCGFQFHFSP